MRRTWLWRGLMVAAICGSAALLPTALTGTSSAAWGQTKAHKFGELDCNGQSPIQKAIRRSMLCTDIRGHLGKGNRFTWGGKFYDNGLYIGHDEPDMNFFSNKPGTGDDTTWVEKLGTDPSAAPTVSRPGHDVSHWFELSLAPWFSTNVCDPNSYPQLPCTPESDSNAPACGNSLACPSEGYPGGGSAFVEMQFYPPGEAPLIDGESCDNTHWCAALNIDSLECTPVQCNPNCTEPVNFALIQRNGVPPGPPSPNGANLYTYTPNAQTLLMSPGDTIKVHMWDPPVPGGGGQKALEVRITDSTTHQVGWIQASAANGFEDTSIIDCSGIPFNFEPEYNTARRANLSPWGAGEENISTEFEIGHFEPCTAVSQPNKITVSPGISDKYFNSCAGPYDTAGSADGTTKPETGDAFCFPKGDTHGFLATAPDVMSQCNADLIQNGDLDFDGSPYWPEWPVSANATADRPASFIENPPTSRGRQYGQFFFTTDVALSESTCTPDHQRGCTVPPKGPGHFYPYWSLSDNHGTCGVLFGNVSSGPGIRNFGRESQYGKDDYARLGYFQFESRLYGNGCRRGAV